MVYRKNLRPTAMIKKARLAMKQAIHKTLVEHKTKGLPIFIWQNEHVVRIPAQRISLR